VQDPNKTYVGIPLDKEFLDRIVSDGKKNKRSRVQQILFVLEQWYAKQEKEEHVLITSLGVEGKERAHERKKAS